MTVACICFGCLEVPLLLGILGALIAGLRKLRRMCDKNDCKCACHDTHKEEQCMMTCVRVMATTAAMVGFCAVIVGCRPTDDWQPPVGSGASAVAVCLGINDYPGQMNDLGGCVNDAKDWAECLKAYGFVTKIYTDAEVTSSLFTTILTRIADSAIAGDRIVITYSGHGTQVKDTDGDEVDQMDEALYLYDNVVTDDDIRKYLSRIPDGVSVTLIFDACFSGTAVRARDAESKIKYVWSKPLTSYIIDFNGNRSGTAFIMDSTTTGEMREVYLAACSDREYAYDAVFNNRPNGAFTYYAIKSLLQTPDPQTYVTWKITLDKYRQVMKQTPQFEGLPKNLGKCVFQTK